MFDIEKFSRNANERVLFMMNFYEQFPDESSKARRFILWFCFKFTPFLINITIMIMLFWIINRIYNSFGFEKAMIWLMGVLILTFRGLSSNVSKILEKYK